MTDKLISLIMQHLDTLSVIRKLTSYCIEHFERLNETAIEFELENRERLINHLSTLTSEIKKIIVNSPLTKEDKEVLGIWNENSQLSLLQTDHLDSLLIGRLEQSIILTKQSIRETVKARKLVHTYNTNSTK